MSSSSSASDVQSVIHDGISYLTAADARAVDEDLLGEMGGFDTEQLMELAGLSVAHAVAKHYPLASHRNVLVVSGGGNNGGDGFIAARHLAQMGYTPYIWVVKTSARSEALFAKLLHQAHGLGIPISGTFEEGLPEGLESMGDADLIVDAVFGFSFKPPLRGDLEGVVASMASSGVPVVAVDVPSGWDVDRGDVHDTGLDPELLISLTLPKLCALAFKGTHVVGGRFVPHDVKEKHGLALPEYPNPLDLIKTL